MLSFGIYNVVFSAVYYSFTDRSHTYTRDLFIQYSGSASMMLLIPEQVVRSNSTLEHDLEVLGRRSSSSTPTGAGIGTGTGLLSKLSVFRNPQFLSLTIAQLISSFGIFIPLYYLQSKAIKKQNPKSIDISIP